MDRSSLLGLVELLGKEFERRHMQSQLESLRIYYVSVQKHLDRHGAVRMAWDEKMTIDWLAMLRVPPYEARYAVHGHEYHCPCTKPVRSTGSGDWSHIGDSSSAVEIVFPGGYKARCNGCNARWLVLEPAPTNAPPTSSP